MINIKKVLNKYLLRDVFISLGQLAVSFGCVFIKYRKRYKDIWIISERPSEARDNGYWLFKYIMDNGLHDNVWYIIRPEASDVAKLEKYSERLIRYGSIKHHGYYCLSSCSISTQSSFSSPSYIAAKYFKRLMPVKKRYVYLGHGILKDDVEFLYRKNAKIDLLITDSRAEAREMKDIGGYEDNNVVITGRPRNDGLHDAILQKEILIMPTNRIWFLEKSGEAREKMFLESTFFHEYQSFMNNPVLHDILKKEGYKLMFFLHPNTQGLLHHFKSGNENISLIKAKDMGMQEALKRAAILITDYSSVAFDFAYMEKPVIYFQFDYEEFRKRQYKEGWFSYKRDGVGEIVDNQHDLLLKILELIDAGCKMDNRYIEKIRGFYAFNDTNNCKRVFDSIINIL